MRTRVSGPVLLVVGLCSLFGCSRDDGRALDPATDVATANEPATTAGSPAPIANSDVSDPADAGIVDTVSTALPPTTIPPTTLPPPASATAPAVVEVPETGVPGLDSDDAFCQAWSRFAGTWQVLSVGANFLDDPELVAGWEIVGSTVIGPAYDALLANFPDELDDERSTVAEDYFGVLERRSAAAAEALDAAGATDDDRTQLGAAWIDALSSRDPSSADLVLTVPVALQSLVVEAAAALRSQRVDFAQDPSLMVTAETPRTDAYLETECPDQGTLSGLEVDGG
ncbi:MAG: hypothetical protein ABIO83_01835 [Ilumatobacteraceae bacterium]